jgi:hypothetical protein
MRNIHTEWMSSASPPNSDIARRGWHFAFVPEGDITPSVDHLVGGHKQCVGHGETKFLRRLEIDGQSNLIGWKIGVRPPRRKSGLDPEQTQPSPSNLIRVVSMIGTHCGYPCGAR